MISALNLNYQNETLQGLLRRNLLAVQFRITTQPKDTSPLLESYTFSFQYRANDDDTDRQLVGLTLADPHGEPVTIHSARSGLLHIVHHLFKLNGSLPALPRTFEFEEKPTEGFAELRLFVGTKFLHCRFFHRSDAPHVWLPTGFQACEEPMSMLPDEVSRMTSDINLGAMNTGFHRSISIDQSFRKSLM